MLPRFLTFLTVSTPTFLYLSPGPTNLSFSSTEQALGETGTYASVFMSRATGGDTGLHIAVALGRLRAAQVRGVRLEIWAASATSTLAVVADMRA